MKLYDVFNAELSKLEQLLADNDMVCTFHGSSYPATLTISPDTSPEAQMSLFTVSDDGATSRDARLTFTFPVGEIGMKIEGRLIMPDALMNKIKGAAKKIHKAYVEGFFADRMGKEQTQPQPQPVAAAEPADTIVEDVSTTDFADFFEDDEDET